VTSLDQGLSSSEARSGKSLGTRLHHNYQHIAIVTIIITIITTTTIITTIIITTIIISTITIITTIITINTSPLSLSLPSLTRFVHLRI
jgi:hypothetical protein